MWAFGWGTSSCCIWGRGISGSGRMNRVSGSLVDGRHTTLLLEFQHALPALFLLASLFFSPYSSGSRRISTSLPAGIVPPGLITSRPPWTKLLWTKSTCGPSNGSLDSFYVTGSWWPPMSWWVSSLGLALLQSHRSPNMSKKPLICTMAAFYISKPWHSNSPYNEITSNVFLEIHKDTYKIMLPCT